jgi:hypothetical protein
VITPPTAARLDHPRFARPQPIGSGSFGTVLRAHDEELNRPVAVKVLHSATPDELAHLKSEFRALRRIMHGGVVRFHELFTDGDCWFYTMDLVDGRQADGWWATTRSAAALRDFAHQLVAAVRAIHSAGTLHRDLKPANVLVDASGHLTIVDFGFALATARRSQWADQQASGTFAYMAPEAMLASSSPASDWYSVGVVLFEMVTGDLPPPHASVAALAAQLAQTPLAAESNAAWIATLIPGLLDHDVRRRALAAEHLAFELGVTPSSMDTAPITFVGRAGERDTLRRELEASRGGARICHVHGPSGIGKSELIARFMDDAIAADAIVLQGRCHTTERVPYNALDECIDDLARLLDHLAIANRLPLLGDEEGRAAAARLFPVLARIPGFDGGVIADASPQRLRRRGIETLREVLDWLAAPRPVVLSLDDVQWGDRDSSALLVDLLGHGAPPLLVLLSYRSPDANEGAFIPSLMLPELPRTEIALLPLDSAAVELWIREQAPDGGDDALARFVIENAHGSPFLVHELLRAAASAPDLRVQASFADILRTRVAALSGEERALLEAATVAARPTDCDVLADAAGAPGGGRLLAEHLAARSLLRIRVADAHFEASVYHDRIRELLETTLDGDARRRRHLGLAEALERRGGDLIDPERLFVHYRGAERRNQAGHWAELAAKRAAEALAFEHAAGLLRQALDLSDTPSEHARRSASLGDALVNGGRGFDGAQAYEQAASLLDTVTDSGARAALPARRDLLNRAAQHLVRSGRMVEGKELFTKLLAEVGVRMPQTADKAMREALLRRVRFLVRGYRCTPCERADMDPDVRERLDLLWDSSVCFSLTNFPISHALGSAHLLEAVNRGDRWGVMRAVGVEAAFEAALGTRVLRRRAARMLDFIDTLVRPDIDDVFWQQSVRIFRSVACWNQGRWNDSALLAEEYADVVQRRCPGRDWEVAVALLHLFAAKAYMGDLRYLAERIPPALADAIARGDDFAANFYRLGEQALFHLAADDPARLRQEIDTAKASWPNEPHHLHHYHHVLIETYLALYEEREQDAWDFVLDRWTMLKEAQYLTVEIGRIIFHHLRGRAALALASRRMARQTRERDPEVRRLLREVDRSTRVIRRSALPPAPPFAAQLAAGAARLRGDHARGEHLLTEAADGYRMAGMRVYAAACEMNRQPRVQSAAEATLRDEGVQHVQHFVATLVPA